jgi:transcriptional regulator HMO1
LIGVMNELIRSYLTHTNKMLGETSGASDIQLNMSKLFSDVASGIVADGALVGGKKRKRQRREKDPNAPKRPLTSYFLYATHVRPEVKASMTTATAKEINDEILRRWNTMPDFEKNVSCCCVSDDPSDRVVLERCI